MLHSSFEQYHYLLEILNQFLMYEPRGHYDMYGTIQVEPDLPDADVAFLFMHNEGYSTMCGHAVTALGRYCIDNKLAKYQEPEAKVNIQCPCGLVSAYVQCSNGKTGAVRFQSIPAFALKLDLNVFVPDYGNLVVDISYGGAFYAFLPLSSVGLSITSSMQDVRTASTAVKKALNEQLTFTHPEESDLSYLYGVIFTDSSEDGPERCLFNLTAYADAAIDRSPCGSGTIARMTVLHAKGLVTSNQLKTFENPITKSKFIARVVNEVKCGSHDAVIVEVTGNGYYTGSCTFTAEKDDGLRSGFRIN